MTGRGMYTAKRAERTRATLRWLKSRRAQVEPSRRRDAIAGSLAGVSLDDVNTRQRPPAGVSHACSVHRWMKIEVAGRKEGTTTLVSVTPTSTAQATEAEGQGPRGAAQGWESKIPSTSTTNVPATGGPAREDPDRPRKADKTTGANGKPDETEAADGAEIAARNEVAAWTNLANPGR